MTSHCVVVMQGLLKRSAMLNGPFWFTVQSNWVGFMPCSSNTLMASLTQVPVCLRTLQPWNNNILMGFWLRCHSQQFYIVWHHFSRHQSPLRYLIHMWFMFFQELWSLVLFRPFEIEVILKIKEKKTHGKSLLIHWGRKTHSVLRNEQLVSDTNLVFPSLSYKNLDGLITNSPMLFDRKIMLIFIIKGM